MLRTRQLLLIFIPALLIASLVLFVRIIQYEPLFPEIDEEDENPAVVTVPVFPDDPIVGNRKAAISIIAFEDFGCPGCQQQTAVLEQLIEKHPKKVKVIWKGLPVGHFPFPTENAQKYGYCANRQGKFDVFKTKAFENIGNLSDATLEEILVQIKIKDSKFRECLHGGDADTYIDRVKQVAKFLNIQSVPTVFVDGKQIDAPHVLEGWERFLGLNAIQ